MAQGSLSAWGHVQESDGAPKLQATREGESGVRIGRFLCR